MGLNKTFLSKCRAAHGIYTTSVPHLHHICTTSTPHLYHIYTTSVPHLYHICHLECEIIRDGVFRCWDDSLPSFGSSLWLRRVAALTSVRLCCPQINSAAQEYMVEEYKRLRQRDCSGSAQSAWRITVRQLESMIRLSEGMARMYCQDQVHTPRPHPLPPLRGRHPG